MRMMVAFTRGVPAMQQPSKSFFIVSAPWRGFALAMLLAVPLAQASAVDALDTACLDCHRPTQDRGAVPVIEGQHADYLRAQLQRFHDRHREGFPMTALSAGLSTERIQAIVDELASRPWQSARPRETGLDTGAGEAVIARFDCASCHGVDFEGGGGIPRLAGQQQDYLERQIRAFGSADRHHPPVAGGSRMYSLSAEEAAAIAASLAQRGR
jgi:cytochrome c553